MLLKNTGWYDIDFGLVNVENERVFSRKEVTAGKLCPKLMFK